MNYIKIIFKLKWFGDKNNLRFTIFHIFYEDIQEVLVLRL